jgi:hypothetical protein
MIGRGTRLCEDLFGNGIMRNFIYHDEEWSYLDFDPNAYAKDSSAVAATLNADLLHPPSASRSLPSNRLRQRGEGQHHLGLRKCDVCSRKGEVGLG